jgi:hypothetical protein
MEETAEEKLVTTPEFASEVCDLAEEDIERPHQSEMQDENGRTVQETGAAAAGAPDEGNDSAFGSGRSSAPTLAPAASSAEHGVASEYAMAVSDQAGEAQTLPPSSALDYQQYSVKARRSYPDEQPSEYVSSTRDVEEGVTTQGRAALSMETSAPTTHPGAYRVVPGGPPRGTSVDEHRNEDPDTPSSADYSPGINEAAVRALSASDPSLLPPAPFATQRIAEGNFSDAVVSAEPSGSATGEGIPFYRQPSVDASALDNMVILAEANLVEEDDDNDDEDESRSHIDATIVFQADPIMVPERMDAGGAEPQKNRGLGFWVAMVAIGLVTIAVVVGVTLVALSRQGSSSTASTDKNSTNTTTLEELAPLFQASLPNYTASVLRDSTSPQSLAFRWVTSPANYEQLVTGNPSPQEDLNSLLVRMTQQYALATLFYASSGDVWWKNNTGWLQGGVHECDWFGCTCNRTDGEKHESDFVLRSLNLTDNGLARTPVPREMGLLTELIRVDLSKNRLTGPVPTELGDLNRLSALRIDSSEVTGSIPTEIGRLSHLRLLSLSNNRMTSVIPTEIGRITNLVELDLALIHGEASVRGSGLVGRLPSELFLLTQLEVLDLATSSLTGSLPTSVGSLKRLSSLALSNNFISGTVPTQLGDLVDLRDLLLVNNHSGTIPTELGRLVSLEQLLITGERLNGKIPTELGNCAKMAVLFLDETGLDGTIPTELSSMKGLEILSVYDTMLTGSFPSGLCQQVTSGKLIVGIDCDDVSCDCGCTCGKLY